MVNWPDPERVGEAARHRHEQLQNDVLGMFDQDRTEEHDNTLDQIEADSTGTAEAEIAYAKDAYESSVESIMQTNADGTGSGGGSDEERNPE